MQIQKINEVYSYVEQPQMQVEVILASKGPVSPPIYTIRMRYPRPIHGEIMTHRVFSRNARSSRAVPVKTMLNEVRNTPYVPWHWGKNQSGMQADEECNEPIKDWSLGSKLTLDRESAWCDAAASACNAAEAFMNAGYHKQNPNRLLEPFSWIDTLITSTDWDNFFWLRTHGAAEPHLQDLAHLVVLAIKETKVKDLYDGEWHLPYITPKDRDACYKIHSHLENADSSDEGWYWLNKISAARCARISYKPFDGDASYEKEIARYNHLVTDERVHASPLEHQAKPDYRIRVEEVMLDNYDKKLKALRVKEIWKSPQLHGNFTGYIQARKLVPNEYYSK